MAAKSEGWAWRSDRGATQVFKPTGKHTRVHVAWMGGVVR